MQNSTAFWRMLRARSEEMERAAVIALHLSYGLLQARVRSLAPLRRYLYRLAAPVLLVVVLSLTAFVPSSAQVRLTSAVENSEFRAANPSATPDDDGRPVCIFCGSKICSGLDHLLWPTPLDAAIIPSASEPVLRLAVRQVHGIRAPPSPVPAHLPPFNVRGPPTLG